MNDMNEKPDLTDDEFYTSGELAVPETVEDAEKIITDYLDWDEESKVELRAEFQENISKGMAVKTALREALWKCYTPSPLQILEMIFEEL